MKKQLKLIGIILVLGMLFFSVSAQTVGYDYDIRGNITSRRVIVLKSSYRSSLDSIVTPEAFEDTQLNIRIYPNPTKGDLIIEVPDYQENEVLTFQVYDINGRLLLNAKKKDGSTNLDFRSFSNGIYILRLTRKGTNVSWRIVKAE